MNALKAPTQAATLLAQLLERLDTSRHPFDAFQYRLVATRLSELLADPEVDWQPLLQSTRFAAELYENVHYADAGLCRSPLDVATRAEVATHAAIEAARQRRPAPAAPDTGTPDATAA